MSIRPKGKSWIVEVYDPVTKKKQHVKPSDFGVETPKNERQARALERMALNARDVSQGSSDESVGGFHARWAGEYGRNRSEGTLIHYDERVSDFVERNRDRPMRSVTPAEGRRYGLAHPSCVAALRVMFNDAKRDDIVKTNPFAALGVEQGRGRADITVLTADEVDLLADVALAECGHEWGLEVAAMVKFAAYVCTRTGETFAAKHSLLDGDEYHLQTQFNSRLRRETAPKRGSTGTLYVPAPAREAVATLPRTLGVDLMWRTIRGKQFTQSNWCATWRLIRHVFMRELPPTHHLHRRVLLDPEDVLDFYELRHFGASYMLNELEIEPWVIAQQLRHKDGGALVIELYGHPSTATAIEKMRRSWRENVAPLRGIDGGASDGPRGIVGGGA